MPPIVFIMVIVLCIIHSNLIDVEIVEQATSAMPPDLGLARVAPFGVAAFCIQGVAGTGGYSRATPSPPGKPREGPLRLMGLMDAIFQS
jgi:hypothetical protein